MTAAGTWNQFFRRRDCRLEWAWLAGAVLGALSAEGVLDWWITLTTLGLTAAGLRFRSWIPLLAGTLLSTGVALWRLPADPPPGAGRPVAGTFAIRVNDPRLTAVPGLGAPGRLLVELERFRLAGETAWRPGFGRCGLAWPSSAAPPRYGSRLEVRGRLETADAPDALLLTDTGEQIEVHLPPDSLRHLRSRGAAGIIFAESRHVTGEAPGVAGRLLALRDQVLRLVLAEVESDDVRRTLAALLFGCGSGITPDSRSAYLRSGTIHLFSVSGMHVGVLAAVVLWLLRPLAPRWRYWTLTGITLLYVLSTGANPPALRAFGLIAAWSILRSLLHFMTPLNALALAGAALLTLNPALAVDMGTLYSLIITGVLLLTAERLRELEDIIFEIRKLQPLDFFRPPRLWRLAAAAAGCIAAFLGGLGISMHFQYLLLPGSVAANLAVLPILSLLFITAGAKILLGGIMPFLQTPLAAALTLFSRLTGGAAELAATVFAPVAAVHPSRLELALYYGALAVLLTARRFRTAAGALAALIGLTAAWIAAAAFFPPELLIASGGSGTPPMVALIDGDSAVVVNVPRGMGEAAAEFFGRRGVTRITVAAFTEGRRRNAADFARLQRRLPVDRLALPPGIRPSGSFIDCLELEAGRENLEILTPGRENFRIFLKKSGFELDYFNPGSKLSMFVAAETTDSGLEVTVRDRGGETRRRLPWGVPALLWTHRLR